MAIATGDRLPQASFLEKDADGIHPVPSDTVFVGRRVVLFGVPGAFTSTCSTLHLPSFMRVAAALRAKGIAEIVCVAVNDPHVMLAWQEATGAGAAGIRMLADPAAEFTRGLGLTFDAPVSGLYSRSQRYAMMADDAVVQVLNVETSRTNCDISGGEAMLAAV